MGDAAVALKSQWLDLTEVQGSIEDISRDKCRRAAAIVTCPMALRHSNMSIGPLAVVLQRELI